MSVQEENFSRFIFLPSVCLAFFLYRACPLVASPPRCRKRSFDRRQVSRTPRKDIARPPSTSPVNGCTRSSTRDTDRRIGETADTVAAYRADRTFARNRRRERLRDRDTEDRSTKRQWAETGCRHVARMSAWKFSQVNIRWLCARENANTRSQRTGYMYIAQKLKYNTERKTIFCDKKILFYSRKLFILACANDLFTCVRNVSVFLI